MIEEKAQLKGIHYLLAFVFSLLPSGLLSKQLWCSLERTRRRKESNKVMSVRNSGTLSYPSSTACSRVTWSRCQPTVGQGSIDLPLVWQNRAQQHHSKAAFSPVGNADPWQLSSGEFLEWISRQSFLWYGWFPANMVVFSHLGAICGIFNRAWWVVMIVPKLSPGLQVYSSADCTIITNGNAVMESSDNYVPLSVRLMCIITLQQNRTVINTSLHSLSKFIFTTSDCEKVLHSEHSSHSFTPISNKRSEANESS